MAVPSGKARIPARTSKTQVPNDCYPSNLVTGESRGEGITLQNRQVSVGLKTGNSHFFWGRINFFGEGVQHIQAFFGGGDLVKTLGRWPCTHLDLKVDPPRPGVQVKHLWYARTSNEHSHHPHLVVPCLHHFAQDHGTLHMRRHSCGNARILRYLGVKCQKKEDVVLTIRRLNVS